METKFKITARTSHDQIEIWPFDTFQEALDMCIESHYLNTEDIQKAKKELKCSIIKEYETETETETVKQIHS